MNYRLPDEEYAVLDYIRSQKGVHIDHLKIIFGSVAVTAVDHLYQYGLINPDFPNEDIWHPSLLGKAYRHKEPEQESLKPEQSREETDDVKDRTANHKTFKKAVKIILEILGVIASVFTIIGFIKGCT